ncbi:MAG: molybdopterin molybdotransferase MoeA [Xanthobacteraceae bacterium]|nr:molybdopterin molybdotransferase MoeA [Xanthobacteraceae bacterium]
MPVADALAAVLKDASPLQEEFVPLHDAHHRTLSRDVAALRTQPPAAMSAMDGYAARSSDAMKGTRLKVIGEAAAGSPFAGIIGAGEAVRILTGGVVPPGADAIVIQEDVRREQDVITLDVDALPGRHIRKAGIDFREGDVLLKRGTPLNDRDLSLAAGMNHPTLAVHRKPKVAILATGDELKEPGSSLEPGQIISSNAYAIHALARDAGADTIDLGIARDTLEDTTRAIRKAKDVSADILVTTGGASVGDHDLVKASLEAENIEIAFWQIALRPGKPLMHGRGGSMRVLGLPGNPTSSYICSFLFLVPLIRALSGRASVHHTIEAAVLGGAVAANDYRQEYLRARLSTNADGVAVATPVNLQDSSLLGNLSLAQAVIIRGPHAPAGLEGERCSILRLPV